MKRCMAFFSIERNGVRAYGMERKRIKGRKGWSIEYIPSGMGRTGYAGVFCYCVDLDKICCFVGGEKVERGGGVDVFVRREVDGGWEGWRDGGMRERYDLEWMDERKDKTNEQMSAME